MDLRTKEGRAKRPEYVRRACELRRRGHTLDSIAANLEVASSTVAALIWDGEGLGAMELQREVERKGAMKAQATKRKKNPKWLIETDPETGQFKCLFNGAGKRIANPQLASLEISLWDAMLDGEVECVGFDDQGESLWQLSR